MFIDLLLKTNYTFLFQNIDVIIYFAIYVIIPILIITFLFVIAIDRHGLRKRYFSIVVYSRCSNIIKLEAKTRGISRKKMIEYIINDYYKNYDPGIMKKYLEQNPKYKKWTYH